MNTKTVHPRERGGSPPCFRACLCLHGPSPRTRGKPEKWERIPAYTGSIPANAGEARQPSSCATDQVHPRERGGSKCLFLVGAFTSGPSPRTRGSAANARAAGCHLGPSPRTRGKQGGGSEMDAVLRSIPANAGEAQQMTSPAPRQEVHPRERGGSRVCCTLRWCLAGPSPRTRGKLSAAQSMAHNKVHPRERGGSFG